MSYITNGDIEKRLGTALYIELTDDTGGGSADPVKVDEARLAAEGEVNSHLAARYQTPVSLASEPTVAAVLRGVALDLAVYRMHLRKPPVPADVVRARADAVAWLEGVAAGSIHLPAMSPLQGSEAGGIVAEKAGPQRTMTRDGMKDL